MTGNPKQHSRCFRNLIHGDTILFHACISYIILYTFDDNLFFNRAVDKFCPERYNSSCCNWYCCLPVTMWFLFGEVSSSSGCLGWATLFYCGTP